MKCFVRIRTWWWLLGIFPFICIDSVKGLNEEFGEFSTEVFSIVTDATYSTSNDLSMRTFREDIVKQNLVFHYFKDGNKTFEDIGLDGNLTDSGCSPLDKFTFIIHGWGQTCDVEWIPKLRDKFTERRGGCIVCIDYGFYKSDSYLRLLAFFRPMTNVITSKLQELKSQGFDPSTALMFGFSLGGQMATAIGRQFGYPLIKEINTCDMAGPGFDFRKVFDHRGAAEQVNCWHTSRNKGTRFYSCHQNVRFGNCGHNQPGESPLVTSHGLCVLYYINAFDYPFYVTPPPARCMSRNPALFIPNNYTVGYDENKSYLSGEVFVPTSNSFPYNLSLEQIRNILTRGSKPLRFHRRRFPVLVQNARNSLRRRFGINV